MERELYEVMDWAAVEEIVYSESVDPHAILGPHKTDKGILVQAFFPERKSAALVYGKTKLPMEQVDESGFFACLIPGEKEAPRYRFVLTEEDGSELECEDPYRFLPELPEGELRKYKAGESTAAQSFLGAHEKKMGGVSGTRFAVFAPNAMRVSVVGDFNHWDGRVHELRRMGDSGIFAIFLPGVEAGALYKYEIKTYAREILLRADPYARAVEADGGSASAVAAAEATFAWEDEAYLEERALRYGKRPGEQAINIYELNLASFAAGASYEELAETLPAYLGKMHYTHVLLMPLLATREEASLGYLTSAYFTLSTKLGAAAGFRKIVNALHQAGIGVLMDWSCVRFPREEAGLDYFDGSTLYEENGSGDTAVFRFGRAEVQSFLFSNLCFLANEFHIDGVRVIDMASALWYRANENRNCYGGGENLDGASFLRRLSLMAHKKLPGFLLIADGSAEWPRTTEPVKNDGLGFDFRCNQGFADGMLSYLGADEAGKSERYGELSYAQLYQYSEQYVLPLSHTALSERQPTLMGRLGYLPFEERIALLRAFFGFVTAHPGKKLLFAGQEFGMLEPLQLGGELDFSLLDFPSHRELAACSEALNAFYLEHPALYEGDGDTEGFTFLNCHSYEENVVVFLRRAASEDLLVAVNFSGTSYPRFNLGVPYAGSYKEIFTTDEERFGGSGLLNPRALPARAMEVDDKDLGIGIRLPAYSALFFACKKREPEKKVTPRAEAEKTGETKEKQKPESLLEKAADAAVKKAAGVAGKAADVAGKAKNAAGKAKDAAGRKAAGVAGKAADVAGAAKKRIDRAMGMENKK